MADDIEPTLTITLKKPITWPKNGGPTYTSITLVEPLAGQVRDAIVGNSVAQTIALIAAVANIPTEVAEAMQYSDFLKASRFFDAINSGDPAIGDA